MFPPSPSHRRRRGGHAPDPQGLLRQVATFPDSAAELGLIPKGLVGALMELGVKHEEAGQLANAIAMLAQATPAREGRSHSRDVALHRGWASLSSLVLKGTGSALRVKSSKAAERDEQTSASPIAQGTPRDGAMDVLCTRGIRV
jgi:hypothetical protein